MEKVGGGLWEIFLFIIIIYKKTINGLEIGMLKSFGKNKIKKSRKEKE